MQERAFPYERLVLVCVNEKQPGETCCSARNSRAIADALKKSVEAAGLKPRVRVSKTYCLGQCALGPNVMILPDARFLSHVTREDVPGIVEALKQEKP
jgi:(2Fe-2S) ferredoxin